MARRGHRDVSCRYMASSKTRDFILSHPVVLTVIVVSTYLWIYRRFFLWLVQYHSTGCEIVASTNGRGYHEFPSCNFNVAPGLDFLLGVVVAGGPFEGPIIAAVVILIPVGLVIGIIKKFSAPEVSPPPDPRPVSPYGSLAKHADFLRRQHVTEDQIKLALAPYRDQEDSRSAANNSVDR